jgi:hypothetical protein
MYNHWMPTANRLLAMKEGDRGECERIARNRKTAVNIAKRAQMLVLAARGLSNRHIALELGAERACGRSGNKQCGPFEWTKGPEKLRRIIELTEQWQSQ